ncbi:hypothetical protein PSYPI_43114, partial [Pseudomonas syringae pv. pisi str. 1704B]
VVAVINHKDGNSLPMLVLDARQLTDQLMAGGTGAQLRNDEYLHFAPLL